MSETGHNPVSVIHGQIRNMVRQAAGTYSAKTVTGIWVEAQPTSDDTSITPIGGTAVTNINKEAFVEGQLYPVIASSVTVGTGGEFLLVIG